MRNQTLIILLTLLLTAGLLLGACAAPPPAAPAVETPAPTQPAAQPTEPPAPTADLPDPTSPPASSPMPESTPIVLTDGLGNTVTLEKPAQKIVSLAPSNTEILFAIGAGDQVVGRDQFSDYPAEAQQAADIGGGFGELNTELIVSLNPDLVLAADLTPPEQVQALQNLGLTVYALPNPTTIPEMFENLRVVAQLTGHEEQAASLVESLEARVAAVEEKVAGVQERPLVFYQLDSTDPNAPWTSGAGTFIDTLLGMAGGENLGNILDSPWAQISLEALLEQDPDIIILGDATWGGITPEMVAARAGWETLSAVKEGKVFPFDDNLVSRPGPRMVDGLEGLAKLLHPDLFP